ncbi:MAG TPA: 1-acyl-sn-glycerol-3-phosphate acyltransferase [Casimicrobiaceae bacterium]|nr:1-acyl-sn-glycerol-3-phosphate acyltransferase [Casimicrobiaceae bacterium]
MSATPIPPAPYVDAPLTPGFQGRFAALALKLAGWRVVLAQPVPARCVVVFYPHTSNWDFPYGLMAKWLVGVHFRFIGKETLFAKPFLGRWLRRWGGIPVDRSGGTGVIAKLAAQFAANEDFKLVVAPEGTRSRTDRWKSGFYHLARAANVPLALSFIDYRRRETGVGGYLDLTGDIDADLADIAAFYSDKTARRPEGASPVRFDDGARPRQAGTMTDRTPHA